MKDSVTDFRLSRRNLIKAGGLAAGATALPLGTVEAQLAALEQKGWSRHPVGCVMCGAFCGLVAMTRDGEPRNEKTVRIFPNPDHPQRGYCGRAASAMWIWNHPLRIRHPMKRVGERGEGKMKQITWDEALDEIAARVRDIVNKYGEGALFSTSHCYQGFSKWLPFALGSPNNLGHESACNLAGIGGRYLVYGPGFSGAGKIDPDYANVRYLMLIGRSLGSAMGCVHTLSQARERGAKVVSIDPRMPDVAYGDVEWVPIKPAADIALLWAMSNVMIRDGLADLKFLARCTNAAYLVKEDGRPLTQADMKSGGSASLFAVRDEATGAIVWQGTEKDEKGKNLSFIENPATKPDLEFTGTVRLAGGAETAVRTCWTVFKEMASAMPPEAAAEKTGIAAKKIVQLTHDFSNFKGVIEDGWYSSKNGNDIETYQMINIVNTLNGTTDQKGGIIVTQSAGFKVPSISQGKGPDGSTWEVPEIKRIDKAVYPETEGTASVPLEAAVTGKPYPVKAGFFVGTTMFHREANTAELIKGLKALDLVVVQDLLPHETVDYADYVLPARYFLERSWMDGVKWARDGSIYRSEAVLDPPEDCEARHDVWIALEIAHRAFPERTERFGYKGAKTEKEFNAFFNGLTEKGFKSFLAKAEEAKPGEAVRIAKDIQKQGFSLIKAKKYGVYPYQKPFGTPTGKIEIYAFGTFAKPGYDQIKPITAYGPAPAYTAPKPFSDEFTMISGKNSTSCSGLAMFAHTTKFIGDRTIWMNPADAARLGIRNGDMAEVSGIDLPDAKGETRVTVTRKVVPGTVFAFGFSGGIRTKAMADNPEFAFVREGVNSHWFAKAYREPVFGCTANNSSVRIRRINR